MKLSTNVGTIDRIVRVILGIALFLVAALAGVASPLVYVVWVIGAVALVTGVAGFCPLYALLRLSTSGHR